MANLRANKITSTEVFDTTGSVQFDGNSSLLVIPSSALTNSAFTIESFAYFTGSTSSGNYTLYDFSAAANGYGMYAAISSGTAYFQFYSTNSSTPVWAISTSFTSYLNRWVHIATSFDGSVYRVFFDGSLIGSVSSATQVVSLNRLTIGARSDSASPVQPWLGHISNFRYVNGTALYTSNFTPPFRELEVIPNTVLLCAQSKTRANEERTGKTITVNGNAVASELTPGLLTNTVRSGGSSAITGSVAFNGPGTSGSGSSLVLSDSNDWYMTGDFTAECWINPTSLPSTSGTIFSQWITAGGSNRNFEMYIGPSGGLNAAMNRSGTNYILNSSFNLSLGQWHHCVMQLSGATLSLYINGVSVSSISVSGTPNDSAANFVVGGEDNGSGSTAYIFNGFISNLRIIKGQALYTQNFTPPARRLTRLPGTVLLCCTDSKSATVEETGKTITVNGNATASNQIPQVGSDGGVVFDGATKINTQNYFYLAAGNTEQRFPDFAVNAVSSNGARGLFGGGLIPSANTNFIDFVTIASTGNAVKFGELTQARRVISSCSSSIRAIWGGGYAPGIVNTMDYVTIVSSGNAVSFGSLSVSRFGLSACSSSTRGIFGGGYVPAANSNVIDYVTIASTGNATGFGQLTSARRYSGTCSSPIRGLWANGYTSQVVNTIDYVTISSTGNASSFGNLTVARHSVGGCSNSTRGLFASGATPSDSNLIDYVTISTLGNSVKFGDLTSARQYTSACSSSIRGVFGGGYITTPAASNSSTIDYVTISSTGNATTFGQLTQVKQSVAACSNGHGGLG